MKFCKKILSFVVVLATLIGTGFISDLGVNTTVSATTAVDGYSIWSGKAADNFADGSGTKEDPYIIATADQLYLALTKITGSTSGVETIESVAGGYQSDKILKQSSTNVYMPVYTPYYYKVADGVEAFYLNDIVGNETLAGAKAMSTGSAKKDWKPGKSFVGNLDGNGVTIYGMYSSTGQGLVYKLDGSSAIKNFKFDSCYVEGSGNVAMVTTSLGTYNNDSTLITIANVTVRNSHLITKRNITISKRSDNNYYNHTVGAAGIVSTAATCENLTIANCLYDGISCKRTIGSASEVSVDMIGGIISAGNSMNNVTITGCVALGAPIVDEVYASGKEIFYNRYDKNQGFQVFLYNSYSDMPCAVTENYPGKYDKLTSIKRISTKATYDIIDMPALDWLFNWHLAAVSGGEEAFDGAVRIIPMVRVNVKAETPGFATQISTQNNNGGAYNPHGGAYFSGTYGMYHALIGSGTEEDPYMIHNAFELARAIASGGMNVYNRLYYKLACDIDASGATWITQDSIGNEGSEKYKYVEFGGELNGDGHVVSGISVGDDQSVGLIPILSATGVVKNLHVRNSCFVSGSEYAGAIVGENKIGAQVIGCSVEECLVASSKANHYIVGRIRSSPLKDSYYIADDSSSVEEKSKYYKSNGAAGEIDVAANQDVWYNGGKDGSTPRLKNYAMAQKLTDVDGDGDANEYTARDLAALKQMLLLDDKYQNLYADVDRNGEINILDLAILCNEMIGDYSNPNNDFWRNIKLEKVNIYYGENDNYDAARKLEIYLEAAVPGVDIKKVVSADKTVCGADSDSSAVYVHANDLTGAPTGELEIIVGDIKNYVDYAKNTLGVNDYSINYDAQKGVLWLNGGSFAGVEQAVLDFAKNSKVETGKIYTVEKATLETRKQAKKVYVDTNFDGEADTYVDMHYAWGDEFDGIKSTSGENSQISIDIWNHARMRTETEVGKAGNYNNVETANEKELANLYMVKDGKLTITRGIKAEHATDVTDRLGYVRLEHQNAKTALNDIPDDDDIIANPGLIKTNHSFLYKQGYAEMYGALPSDGHTFASWWMLGHGAYNNHAMEETLFSKIFKLNNKGEYAYDGTSIWPTSTDPRTYKYQMPTNYFEIDIWELMQHPERAHSTYQKTLTTGSYDYRIWLNVHKFYSVGARNQATVNVIDWDNPGTPRAVMKKEWFGTPADDYYFSSSPNYLDFTDGKTTRMTKDWLGRITANYVEALQKQFTAPRRYGFYWSTNGVDKFNFTLYIYDINGDGVEGDDAILGTSDMTYNTQDKMNPQDYDCVNDAEVANQYMYFLFDNILYTSNSKHNNSTADNAVMFTDMLTDEGTAANPDKIDLEIDYLRVYQLDGRRDIITEETENFNNGNHFGY